MIATLFSDNSDATETYGTAKNSEILTGILESQKARLVIDAKGRKSTTSAKRNKPPISKREYPNVETIKTSFHVDAFLKQVYLLKGIENEFDKQQNPPTLVGDLVSNINALKKLVSLLEEALVRAKTPEAEAGDCIKFVQDGFAGIMNPNLAIQKELAQLVEAKTPPNGEYYKSRVDKNEFAVAFFHRVYGDFYEAKVLRYKSQIQAMDPDFAHLLGQYTNSIRLLSKREENDEALARIGSFGEVMRLASVAARRKSAAV